MESKSFFKFNNFDVNVIISFICRLTKCDFISFELLNFRQHKVNLTQFKTYSIPCGALHLVLIYVDVTVKPSKNLRYQT